MFSYVLLKSDVGIVVKPTVFLRISASRAAAASRWPAWYYVTGMVPLASARMSLREFNASAKVAREGPFDRNVENHVVFKVSTSARGQMFRRAPMRKHCVFICFIEVRCRNY